MALLGGRTGRTRRVSGGSARRSAQPTAACHLFLALGGGFTPLLALFFSGRRPLLLHLCPITQTTVSNQRCSPSSSLPPSGRPSSSSGCIELVGPLPIRCLKKYLPDRFVWRWSPDGVYSSSSAYKAFFHGLTLLPGARQLWRASVPPKVKFFAWLALHGRIWTSDRRRRHGLQDDASCALCDQEDETADHLLLGCVFTREVWHRLLRSFRLPLQPPATPSRPRPSSIGGCSRVACCHVRYAGVLTLLFY